MNIPTQIHKSIVYEMKTVNTKYGKLLKSVPFNAESENLVNEGIGLILIHFLKVKFTLNEERLVLPYKSSVLFQLFNTSDRM